MKPLRSPQQMPSRKKWKNIGDFSYITHFITANSTRVEIYYLFQKTCSLILTNRESVIIISNTLYVIHFRPLNDGLHNINTTDSSRAITLLPLSNITTSLSLSSVAKNPWAMCMDSRVSRTDRFRICWNDLKRLIWDSICGKKWIRCSIKSDGDWTGTWIAVDLIV